DLAPYAREVQAVLEKAGLRCEVDERAESLKKKVREAQLAQTPLILTIGGKEKEAGTLSVRTLDGKVRYGVAQEDFIQRALANIKERKLTLDLFEE
ncbi:MAG: threonine--tRNA ligase, partial [Desulfobacterales bacterium]|nr:threonine--tRNA ligase [Desulfobacterales bacterium]